MEYRANRERDGNEEGKREQVSGARHAEPSCVESTRPRKSLRREGGNEPGEPDS